MRLRLSHQKNLVAAAITLSSVGIAFYIFATQNSTNDHIQSITITREKSSTATDVRTETCTTSPFYNDTSDINTFNVYRDFIAYENVQPDQPINQNSGRLKVFVVPFSHVDPGWLRTFASYSRTTDSILDNMHQFMIKNQNMTFTWTELSFFEIWWSKQNSSTRDDVRRLVKSGRLEMTTGSWVMTDEATVYYPLSVDNIIEGYQFLKEAFGDVVPEVMWSCDPFGYSNTVPYLFNQAGMKRAVISRVHRGVKHHLQSRRAVPFRWRQYFDHLGSSEMLTYVLPYSHYDFLNVCGPNPSICCQFDFKKLDDSYCPGPKPVSITSSNVAERAQLFTSQLQQMAELFEANVLLLVLGDDFRYAKMREWYQQHDNFQVLFDEINNRNIAEIRFGTFSDYFNALEKWYAENGKIPATLSGDFFPYMCGNGDYWSGYYTTRPFVKRQERATHNIVRAADLMAAQARLKMNATLAADVDDRLRKARRILSLFQHHDAITGTSREHVMMDYSKMLHNASALARSAFEDSAGALAGENIYTLEYSAKHDETEDLALVEVAYSGTLRVNIYNSLPYNIQDVVSLRINTPFMAVSNENGEIEAQVEPYIQRGRVSKDTFLLSFRCNLVALSTSSFTLKNDVSRHSVGLVTVYAHNMHTNSSWLFDLPSVFKVRQIKADEFYLDNEQLKTSHDAVTGLLTHVSTTTTGKTTLMTNFFVYNGAFGGAYVMKVSDSPKKHTSGAIPRFLTRGPIQSTAHLFCPDIYQRINVKNVEGSLGQQVNMFLRVNIVQAANTELIMRIVTDLNSPRFYADSAGLQLLRRQRYSRLPDPANFYPMPSAAVLEDDHKRITVASNVPHGVTPLNNGMDIVLDRILNQDDGKGLDASVTDLLPVEMRFSLLIESIRKFGNHEYSTYHTPASHLLVQNVMYPPIITVGSASVPPLQARATLPCNYQLLTVRGVAGGKKLLTLFSSGNVCHTDTATTCTGDLKNGLKSYLYALGVAKIQETNVAGTPISEEIFLRQYSPSVQPYKFLSMLLSF